MESLPPQGDLGGDRRDEVAPRLGVGPAHGGQGGRVGQVSRGHEVPAQRAGHRLGEVPGPETGRWGVLGHGATVASRGGWHSV